MQTNDFAGLNIDHGRAGIACQRGTVMCHGINQTPETLPLASHLQLVLNSQKQFFPLIKQLGTEKPSGQTHLTKVLKKVALSPYSRGICFLFSDFYSYDGFEGFKMLAAKGHELHFLQILTQEETNPIVRGDLKLLDSETKDHSEVSITPQILKRYLSRLKKFQQEVRETAYRCLGTYHTVTTSDALSSLILRDLRTAGIVA